MKTEAERIAELHLYNILDTPPDEAFDRITAIAAHCFTTPIALISLVDKDRIWFKSKHGLNVDQLPRVPGLCPSAILSDNVYVVRNALCDDRTSENPLVIGSMGLRFYAAAPLITHDGHRLGTLNVIDTKERDFSKDEEFLLKQLAGVVVDQMVTRLAAQQTISSLSKVMSQIKQPKELLNMVTVCAWTKKIKIGDEWMSFEKFMVEVLGLPVTHGITPEAANLLQSLSGKPK